VYLTILLSTKLVQKTDLYIPCPFNTWLCVGVHKCLPSSLTSTGRAGVVHNLRREEPRPRKGVSSTVKNRAVHVCGSGSVQSCPEHHSLQPSPNIPQEGKLKNGGSVSMTHSGDKSVSLIFKFIFPPSAHEQVPSFHTPHILTSCSATPLYA
jgi:hypothetical protein